MVLTAIQIQSLIVVGVLLFAVAIVGTYACKIEREEEEERLARIRERYNEMNEWRNNL